MVTCKVPLYHLFRIRLLFLFGFSGLTETDYLVFSTVISVNV